MNGRFAIVLLLFFLFSGGVGVNLLRVNPHGIVYPIRTEWLDTKIPHGGKEVFEDRSAPTPKIGGEAAPEGPASPFEDPLSCHVISPLAGAVESIPIALDSKPSSFAPLDHEVNSKASASHLWFNTVAPFYQLIEHVPFKIRVTAFPEDLGIALVLAKRFAEMPDQPPVKSVLGKSGVIHGPE
jgi:hypothetical protein